MADLPARGRRHGRLRGRGVIITARRGRPRAPRTITPPIEIEEVAESEGQLVMQPRGPQIEFESWFPTHEGMRHIVQYEVILVAQSVDQPAPQAQIQGQ